MSDFLFYVCVWLAMGCGLFALVCTILDAVMS